MQHISKKVYTKRIVCPKCNGDGHYMKLNNWPSTNTTDTICPDCGGNGILLLEHTVKTYPIKKD